MPGSQSVAGGDQTMMAASRITRGLGSGACQDSSRNAACSCEAAFRCLAKQHQEHQLGEPGSFQGLEMPSNAEHSLPHPPFLTSTFAH